MMTKDKLQLALDLANRLEENINKFEEISHRLSLAKTTYPDDLLREKKVGIIGIEILLPFEPIAEGILDILRSKIDRLIEECVAAGADVQLARERFLEIKSGKFRMFEEAARFRVEAFTR